MQEQLSFDIVDNYFDTCCSSKSVCKAWQTLKAAVLAQQRPTSAMDAIAICQHLSRFDDKSDMCPESLARLIRGARKLQQHQ